jgi:hypothetical protein
MENSTLTVNYEKRKNSELFKSFNRDDLTFLSDVQNYLPIYKRFFLLNDTNCNSVNLNHQWFLSSIKNGSSENKNLYNCTIQNLDAGKTKKKQVFFKMAPLLDPFKFLIGKYNVNDNTLFKLPKFASDVGTVHPKLLDCNNSAYVDGLFSFLSSKLIYSHNFINGVDYYGSFLGIKNDFKLNVIDDLDYLCKSDYFNKNKNVAFQVEDYSFLYKPDEPDVKPPIKIDHAISNKSSLSAKSIDDSLFEDIFASEPQTPHITLDDLKENNIELLDITNSVLLGSKELKTTTIKSSSTCSSRTSHTSNDESESEFCGNCNDDKGKKNDNEDFAEDVGENEDKNNDKSHENDNKNDESDENDENNSENWTDYNSGSGSESGSDSSDDCEEQNIYATIPQFPVQVICMENCENTFDDLIMNNELNHREWFSALFQIVMILITYQKAFSFTHNDLHTNNVMYNPTDEKYIYYCYKKTYYKVPTFGRIFKIIDFGRAIYRFDGKLFCSDSFQPGADAATQYNTEPYFNEKKPRLEPNYSFDLCRLACSIFDYLIEDLDELNDLDKCEPIVRLIYEWCLDDNGINILYKNNGLERYPDFKLYKMIARCVHHHTPHAQLEREEFKIFAVSKSEIPSDKLKYLVNIDSIPCFSSENA